MGRKADKANKRKEKPRGPSTGQGAASAMDALIKRRVPPPGQPNPEGQPNQQGNAPPKKTG